MKDPNIIYPGRDSDFVFPEEGSDMPIPPTLAQIDDPNWNAYQAGLADGKASTIERCAQVADRFASYHTSEFACHPAIRHQIEFVAAAIRALKEKS